MTDIRTIIGASFGAGAVVGTGLGFLLAKKLLQEKYEAISEREIAEARAFFGALREKPSPESLVQDRGLGNAVDALKEYASDEVESVGRVTERPTRTETEAATVVTNIFVEAEPRGDTWDQVLEESRRTEVEPYIISEAEYNAGERDYVQNSLAFFAEDGILVDEREKPIEDTEAVVGDDNLTKFGHGSNDKNMLFIRNDKLEIDMEIALSQGSYTKEVLGFIEHEDHRLAQMGRRRRYRDEE